MKICKKNESFQRKNADNCLVTEYEISDDVLDFAVVRVDGRYPESGLAINRKVKEIVYVGEGAGIVCVNEKLIELDQGDVILIDADEPFYWEGHFTLYIACNPAFTVEQHQTL